MGFGLADRPPVVIVPGSLHSRLQVWSEPHGHCEGTDGLAIEYINWTRVEGRAGIEKARETERASILL